MLRDIVFFFLITLAKPPLNHFTRTKLSEALCAVAVLTYQSRPQRCEDHGLKTRRVDRKKDGRAPRWEVRGNWERQRVGAC